MYDRHLNLLIGCYILTSKYYNAWIVNLNTPSSNLKLVLTFELFSRYNHQPTEMSNHEQYL